MDTSAFVYAIVGCLIGAAAIGAVAGPGLGTETHEAKRSRAVWKRRVSLASRSFSGAAAVALLWALCTEPVLPALFFVTMLNLVLGEEFPFSAFPMYANPSGSTFFLRFADASGETIALGMRARACRKIYARERAAIARGLAVPPRSLDVTQLGPAAERIFDYLEERAQALGEPPLPSPIRLFEVVLRVRDGEVEREERLVGERTRA